MKPKKSNRKAILPRRPARPAGDEPARERRVPLGLEEIYREARGKPAVLFFPMTREMAQDWFSNHLNEKKQRKISQPNITNLLRMMESGFWTDFKANVVFDANRDIRNGQHVLSAAIQSTTHDGFIICLMVNLPPSACDSWDLVRKRSAADELKTVGYEENPNVLSKAAKVLWQYQRGFYDGLGYQFDRRTDRIAQPPEVTAIVKDNPGLERCLLQMDKCFRGRQFAVCAVQAAYYVLGRIDQKAADTFFRCLNDGLGVHGKDNPVYALRSHFLRLPVGPKGRIRNGPTMFLVLKAWCLYRADLKVTGPLMRKNEPFPKLEEIDVPDGPHTDAGRVQ